MNVGRTATCSIWGEGCATPHNPWATAMERCTFPRSACDDVSLPIPRLNRHEQASFWVEPFHTKYCLCRRHGLYESVAIAILQLGCPVEGSARPARNLGHSGSETPSRMYLARPSVAQFGRGRGCRQTQEGDSSKSIAGPKATYLRSGTRSLRCLCVE